MNKLILLIAFLLSGMIVNAQNDLMDLFGEDSSQIHYTAATFKSTRLILGQSIENPARGALVMMISHQFGRLNSGFYEFWGLENAVTRIGFEYGINDHITIGLGRSTNTKLADFFIKSKLLRQSTGLRNMPLSISYFGSLAAMVIRKEDLITQNIYNSRNQYVQQLLIARKFSNAFSLQISPTYIYRDLVDQSNEENNVFALGIGGRLKITNRTTLNVEYFYLMSDKTSKTFKNTFSIGFDIETGGHVFQLFISNSQAMIEQVFIPQTTGDWGNGDIHFGFNMSRVFNLKKKKEDIKIQSEW